MNRALLFVNNIFVTPLRNEIYVVLTGVRVCLSLVYIQTMGSVWRENMLGYLSADIVCSDIGECLSMKTVNFEEQIMYKDKYSRVFSRQMEAIVLIILKYFSNTRKLGHITRKF